MVIVVTKNLEEAPALTAWAIFFAQSDDEKRSVRILHVPAIPTPDLDPPGLLKYIRDTLGPSADAAELSTDIIDDNHRAKAVLQIVRAEKPRLVIVSRQRTKKGRRSDTFLAQRLFEQCPCDTMLLRPGESRPPPRTAT
jgi:hypothetical protein